MDREIARLRPHLPPEKHYLSAADSASGKSPVYPVYPVCPVSGLSILSLRSLQSLSSPVSGLADKHVGTSAREPDPQTTLDSSSAVD